MTDSAKVSFECCANRALEDLGWDAQGANGAPSGAWAHVWAMTHVTFAVAESCLQHWGSTHVKGFMETLKATNQSYIRNLRYCQQVSVCNLCGALISLGFRPLGFPAFGVSGF